MNSYPKQQVLSLSCMFTDKRWNDDEEMKLEGALTLQKQ